MLYQPRKSNSYRRKGQNLISANKIKPEQWHISHAEAKAALTGKGYKVQQIKKIHCLKHQVCISYWDERGNICSSFFSYRIFSRWQKAVEQLVDSCLNFNELKKLNYIMQYEFANYHYFQEMEDAIYTALENRLCALKITSQQVV
ncbi:MULTISPECIES: hypothetical protein [unclassified Tolypothrix]|uniref:hypothetical protein n=1 Tax=unclassified Tolypothrix TaxID=2649714 RepID=UPI0005F82573|nr:MULTISPECIES: hypothetical protein [unclassified Tolypothrix]MBE9081167.1 hypothetical protein [Tolypothrix sp. LEGE 11397]UYD29100.1 hypothetical protein HGR01_14305 [Tolypothrix sp. PCC 7712]UYD34987.1 hypothetical protein HG267_04035 [Tolypothrix sp. PCC 7601]